MKLSRESRYAIMALAVLSGKPPDTILEVSQIAAEADLPAPFLAKTFGKLTRHGILTSHRGKERGYSLSRSSESLHMKEILEAIDGPDIFERCVFWTETCDEKDPCPLHDSWRSLKPLIAEAMEATTLRDVRDGGPAASRTGAGRVALSRNDLARNDLGLP